MTSMTPTEQDKELLTKMRMLGEKYYGNELYGEHLQYQHELQELITADRKRVALEARIAEINYLDDNFQTDSQDWEREHPGYSTAMIPMEDYIRRRTELKAQQEEV